MRKTPVNTFLYNISLSFILVLLCANGGYAQTNRATKKIRYTTDLQQALLSPEAITHLKLKGQDLDTVPAAIAELRNLIVLDLSKNNIRTIPGFIVALPAIKVLNLSKNKITQIPREIDRMDVLEELIINQNPITELPKSIVGCRSLKYIDAWGTEINHLDSSIAKAPKLTLIDLQSIRMGNKTQQAIVDNIKGKVKVKMSAPCDCD
jgi:Leucine-rich repeat (LRR) protein